MRWRTLSELGFEPARSARSQAYNGKQPIRRRFVRVLESRVARAAMGGMAVGMGRVGLAWVLSAVMGVRFRTRRSFWIRVDREGSFG